MGIAQEMRGLTNAARQKLEPDPAEERRRAEAAAAARRECEEEEKRDAERMLGRILNGIKEKAQSGDRALYNYEVGETSNPHLIRLLENEGFKVIEFEDEHKYTDEDGNHTETTRRLHIRW